ncbi:MAG: V-type ATP synthase subunit E family protein [Methanomicrobiales archaeon]|nr:V-type ATP synthase subunit E family protein [Methanomicrobiales archaeon]
MGLETVVADIQEKGRREVEAIRAETRREVEAILRSAQQRVEEIKLAAERDVKEQIDRMMAQEDSAATLVVKRQVLNAQKEVLDEVYRKTLAELSALPAEFHQEAIRKLLKKAVKEINTGLVFCNARDTPFVQSILKEGEFAGFRIGGTLPIEGGAVVESIDGALKLDLSYRTHLDRVWEKGLKEASDALFS